jgi:hypothetical protein
LPANCANQREAKADSQSAEAAGENTTSFESQFPHSTLLEVYLWVEARTGPGTLLRHAGETYRLDAAKRVSRFTELHQ